MANYRKEVLESESYAAFVREKESGRVLTEKEVRWEESLHAEI